MINTAKLIYQFVSKFGLPAYVEGYVPDDAKLPYITYTLVEPDWREQASFTMRVWYKSTSYSEINAKIDEISKAIGGGICIPNSDGYIIIYKDTVFSQFQPYDSDSNVKVAYLSMILNALTN